MMSQDDKNLFTVQSVGTSPTNAKSSNTPNNNFGAILCTDDFYMK